MRTLSKPERMARDRRERRLLLLARVAPYLIGLAGILTLRCAS